MSQGDDVDDIFDGQLRTALTMAGHVGQVVSKQREEHLRNAEQQDRRQAEDHRARVDAERQAARAELSQVHRDEWWHRAGIGQVGAAWQTANAWSEQDTEAARGKDKIGHELYERYGVDVNDLSTASPQLREAEAAHDASGHETTTSTEAERTAQWIEELAERYEREQREAQREAATTDNPVEQTEAEAEASDLERDATNLDAEAGVEHDSAERREGEAHRMAGAGVDQEAAAARMHADTQHARPAREAAGAKTGRGRRQRARKGRAGARRTERGMDR